MTLIGAFRAQGLPVLIGDFRLSIDKEPVNELRKKVRRLRSNLVVAWTGSIVAAEHVLSALNRDLPPGRVSHERLRRTLTGFDVSELGTLQVSLIGWVVDEAERCFRWRSDYPGELFDLAAAFDGTGGDLIEAIVGKSDATVTPRDPVEVEAALLRALYVSTRLMGHESADPGNSAGRTFGHAYELVYWDGNSFKYLDRVLYATVLVEIDHDATVLSIAFAGAVYRYRSRQEVAIVDRLNGGERVLNLTTALADPGGRGRARSLASEYQAAIRLKSFELSHYSCLFLQVFSDRYVAMPGAFTQGPSVPDDEKWLLEDRSGHMSLRLPTKLVSEIARVIKGCEETGQLPDSWPPSGWRRS